MESVSSYLEDEDIRIFGHKLTPFALRLIITIGCFIFGLVMMTRAGVYWFDFYDTFAATGPMLLLCVMEAFLFAFYPAIDKFKVKIWEETQEPVPTYFAPSLKYVATVVSTFLFIYAYFDLVIFEYFIRNSQISLMLLAWEAFQTAILDCSFGHMLTLNPGSHCGARLLQA